MKVKLFLVAAIIGIPFLIQAQTAPYLYNQGKMIVKGTGTDNTTLYIKGDFVSGTDAAKTTVSNITLNNSRTVLTGNFYHTVPNTLISNVFDVSSPSTGYFEFRGTSRQNITTAGSTYETIPDKGISYVGFPTLLINNPDSVVVSPALALKSQNLNLLKGKFILDSERITSDNQVKYYSNGSSTSTPVANPDERTAMAYLLANNVTYTNSPSESLRGDVQINMALDIASSYTYKDGRYGSIVGFGIPFQQMNSDYFTWNYLFQPVQESVFGPEGKPLSDPQAALIPGRGYIVGNGLLGTDYADYEESDFSIGESGQSGPGMGEARFNARFKDGYVFNRSYFANLTNSNNRYGAYSATNAAYTGEKLNTGDVTITLSKGYNYLANPYTCPLDISALLESSATKNAWGVISGTSTIPGRQLLNSVWIVSGTAKGSALYDMKSAGQPTKLPYNSIQASLTTVVAKSVGGTYVDDDGGRTGVLIPGLQMFIVYSYVDGIQFTIPASKRVMGRNQFIRSGEMNSSDDFVFEVYDQTTRTSDRVSVVLRKQSDILSNPEYSNLKKNNASISLTQTKSEGNFDSDLKQGISSQLYTTGTNNEKLLVNFVPYTKNVDSKIAVPLSLLPSSLEQNISLKGLTLNSLTEFDNVILEDKLLGKQTLMTPDTEYITSIKPTDPVDRFVLYFTKGVDGIEDEIENNTSKSIYSNYSNGTLTVGGFDDNDFGSLVSVYDIQGRFITQKKVNDFTVTITDNFAPGAFIVKVSGNNTYVSKFLVR